MTDPTTGRLPEKLWRIDRMRPPYIGPLHPLYGGTGPVPDRFIPQAQRPETETQAWHEFLLRIAEQGPPQTPRTGGRGRHRRPGSIWSMLTRSER